MTLDWAGYRVLCRLGDGKLGAVYRAEAPDGRIVALKTLRSEYLVGRYEAEGPPEEALRRMRVEANVLAGLDHPGLPRLHDAHLDADPPCIALEWIDGTPLSDHLGTPWPRGRLREAGLQMASALFALEGAGVVHRDLKAPNILRTCAHDGERFVVVDLGLAVRPRLDPEGARLRLGTPDHMAPELILGRGVDARADLFALGIVLHQLATGRHPFPADDPDLARSRIVHGPPADLSAVDEDLRPLLRDLLAQDRNERLATHLDVLRWFDGWTP